MHREVGRHAVLLAVVLQRLQHRRREGLRGRGRQARRRLSPFALSLSGLCALLFAATEYNVPSHAARLGQMAQMRNDVRCDAIKVPFLARLALSLFFVVLSVLLTPLRSAHEP